MARPKPARDECAEIGCHDPCYAGGYCRNHYKERWRAEKIKAGICGSCGARPIDLAYESLCEECARAMREKQRGRRRGH